MGIGLDLPDPSGGLMGDLPGGSYLFNSETEKQAQEAANQKKEAAEYYGNYAPEAMRVRQESMRQAAMAFSPLQQYIQRMTGAQPFDVQSPFKPVQEFQDRQVATAAEADKSGGGYWKSAFKTAGVSTDPAAPPKVG